MAPAASLPERRATMPRKKKCALCKGTGEFAELRKNGRRVKDGYHRQTTICLACSGTGYQ